MQASIPLLLNMVEDGISVYVQSPQVSTNQK